MMLMNHINDQDNITLGCSSSTHTSVVTNSSLIGLMTNSTRGKSCLVMNTYPQVRVSEIMDLEGEPSTTTILKQLILNKKPGV